MAWEFVLIAMPYIYSSINVSLITLFTVHFIAFYDTTEIDHVMQTGKTNRSTGATAMNQTSSRSHSIFTIVVECGESDARYVCYCVQFTWRVL